MFKFKNLKRAWKKDGRLFDPRIDILPLISCLPGGIMVEIGSYAGRSTVEFARKFETVFAIDPWLGQYCNKDVASQLLKMSIVEEEFDRHTSTFKNIVKLKGTSEQRVNEFEDESLDFVYIDGNHTYEAVCQDIDLWYPKVKMNGHIGGHDYNLKVAASMKNSLSEQVIRAVNEHFGKPDKSFQDDDVSWLVKKVEGRLKCTL